MCQSHYRLNQQQKIVIHRGNTTCNKYSLDLWRLSAVFCHAQLNVWSLDIFYPNTSSPVKKKKKPTTTNYLCVEISYSNILAVINNMSYIKLLSKTSHIIYVSYIDLLLLLLLLLL